MSDHSELKRLAKSMKGWDKMSECWPCDENGPDWHVGRLDEDDNRWPLLTVDSEQYDQEQDAPMIAQYYAAANPAAVLALIAEVEALRKDAERYRWLREKVGVDLIFGDYSPWLLSCNTDMTDLEKKTTDEAIDAAMTKVAKP